MTSLRRTPLALLAALAVLLSACSGGGSPAPTTAPAPPKITVVATTTQIGDFAKVIAGDLIDLKIVAEPGTNPHSLVPTPDDITSLATARVILKNGAGLENWFDNAFDDSQSSGVVYDISRGIQLRTERVDDKIVADPHYWMSVVNARIMVANVTAALAEADPANAVIYQSVERSYGAQLEALSLDIKSTVARQTDKRLVTTHDDFGYYTDEFRLTDGGSISSLDPAATSTTRTQTLIDDMRLNGAKAVFGDSTESMATTNDVATQAGAKAVGGNDVLYGDSLGPAGSDADTYLKMMRHNAGSIARNLG